jgi:UDP-N-acetylmuramyl tripeptide synthase
MEVDEAINKMKDSLRSIDVKLILNADDPFVHRFSDLNKQNLYIGLDVDAYHAQLFTMSDSKYCPVCQKKLSYSTIHYGQLGHYHCSCGFSRPQPTFSAEKVDKGKDGIRLTVDGKTYPTTLMGTYNAYNVLLALCLCQALRISMKGMREGANVVS